MTSAVTGNPRCFASRTISTEPTGRDVAEVNVRPNVGRKQDVPSDDRLLGHARPPAQAQPARELALVHLRTVGQPRLLRVLGDDSVEGLHVLERPAHEHRVGHAAPVVGEDPDPGR